MDSVGLLEGRMANNQGQKPNLDRYVVIHVATTCDEHGVYVTKDSAEVIELGWILLDAKGCEEVRDKEEENKLESAPSQMNLY